MTIFPLSSLFQDQCHDPGENGGKKCVFAGDALFAGSIGRTDLWKGSYAALEKAIKTKLYALPDDTVVYTGHGPFTTIGEEKKNNCYVRG